MIPLKPGMSLPELQEYIADMKKRRGFQVNLEKEFILLVEEVGELAKELKQVWRAERKLKGDDAEKRLAAIEANKKQLEGELADCLIYLLNIGNLLNIDLQKALIEKEQLNETRRWDRL